MTIRTRKLIGTIAIVSFSLFYFFVAVTIALARLPGTPGIVHLAFYLAITAIWCVISGAIIYWMQKPDAAQATEALRQ